MNIAKFLVENFKTLLLIALIAVFSTSVQAESQNAEGEKFNAGELIMHHITDSHEWHLATIGHTHLTIPLPVILYSSDKGLDIFPSSAFHHSAAEHSQAAQEVEPVVETEEIATESAAEPKEEKHIKGSYNGYLLDTHEHITREDGGKVMDLSITKNVMSMIISAILLIVIFTSVAGKYKNIHKAPSGLQNFLEVIIVFIRDEIAKPALGDKTEKFLPYLLTLFFFILVNNLLGLLPGGANVTGNISITLTLAVITFIITNVNGTKSYWGHIFNTPGVPMLLKTAVPIMPIVEFIGIFTKPFSLMVRLFANITAGHIIILSLISLTFIFQSFFVGLGAGVFATALNFLELLVAFVQAGIFTMLTANYIGAAVTDHHHGHDSHGYEAHH